jgi:hypothetical protein
MARYRKLPIVIEAEQWFPDRHVAGVLLQPGDPPMGTIHTLEDRSDSYHWVTPGDYIIKGVDGELYPCKESIFRRTYEEVTDEDVL